MITGAAVTGVDAKISGCGGGNTVDTAIVEAVGESMSALRSGGDDGGGGIEPIEEDPGIGGQGVAS